MNEKIKELAKESGFDYDPTDCNFYSPDSSQWINKEIYKLAQLIIQECLSNMENSDGDLDYAIWKTKTDFGLE